MITKCCQATVGVELVGVKAQVRLHVCRLGKFNNETQDGTLMWRNLTARSLASPAVGRDNNNPSVHIYLQEKRSLGCYVTFQKKIKNLEIIKNQQEATQPQMTTTIRITKKDKITFFCLYSNETKHFHYGFSIVGHMVNRWPQCGLMKPWIKWGSRLQAVKWLVQAIKLFFELC